MLLKGLKENSIRKIIKKEQLRASEGLNSQEGPLKRVAILINYDKLQDYRPLMNLGQSLQLGNDEVHILGYVERLYKNVNYFIPVFSRDAVNSRGVIKEESVKTFLQRSYDLLVCYHSAPTAEAMLISSRIKAPLKVGIVEEQQEICDLILKVPEGDFSVFSEELLKYLKILKRI